VAKGDDIQERMIDFSVRIMRVCNNLPRSRAGRHVSDQLLRCGTAPAAQYAEARSAESAPDFIHKLKISLKELNETQVWLKTIARSEMLSPEMLREMIGECVELSRIINASITTARSSAQSSKVAEQTFEYASTGQSHDIDN
jgi:four helix bundle protein